MGADSGESNSRGDCRERSCQHRSRRKTFLLGRSESIAGSVGPVSRRRSCSAAGDGQEGTCTCCRDTAVFGRGAGLCYSFGTSSVGAGQDFEAEGSSRSKPVFIQLSEWLEFRGRRSCELDAKEVARRRYWQRKEKQRQKEEQPKTAQLQPSLCPDLKKSWTQEVTRRENCSRRTSEGSQLFKGSFAGPACSADSSVHGKREKGQERQTETCQRPECQQQQKLLELNQFFLLQSPRSCSCCGEYGGQSKEDVQTSHSVCEEIHEVHREGDGRGGPRISRDRLHAPHQLWQAKEPGQMPSLVRHCARDATSGGLCRSSSSSDSVPASAPPGCHRLRLDSGMAVDLHSRSVREEAVGRRRHCSAARDCVCAEHAGPQQELRATETQKSASRRRCRRGEAEKSTKGERQEQDQRGREDGGLKSEANLCTETPSNAKPFEVDPCLKEAYKSWGSFGRFLKLINMEKSPNIDSCDKGSGPRTPLVDKGCTSLFPSLLAIPDTFRRSRSARCRARGRGHREAWEWVKVLWALFTFFEGGSPFKAADQKELVARARNTTWTSTHSEYAGCLHKQINRYLRMRDEDQSLSRGILKLSELVKIVKSSAYQGHKVDGTMQQVAKNVKPDRMSLPSKAGIIEPQDFLKGSQLEQFRTMPEHIPVENTNEPPVKGCFKVLDEDLPGVYRKLLESGVAVLLPEELAVRGEDGKILTGGLFAVNHKEHSDRIILDRRPFNQVERRLVWAKLPHGCLLTQLILPKGHSIRGSGDDLSNYFYLLKHNPNWLPRNAIGSVFDGEGFEAFGGSKGSKISAFILRGSNG